MLLIPCPQCGLRSELEFRHAGEAHLIRPDVAGDSISDHEWAQYVFFRDNPRGELRERWQHIHGCGHFFNVLRDTVSDKIMRSYPIGQDQ